MLKMNPEKRQKPTGVKASRAQKDKDSTSSKEAGLGECKGIKSPKGIGLEII